MKQHWITQLALAGLVAASKPDGPKVGDFDWETITPSRKLEYHPCYSRFRCARLVVPLDWHDASNPHTVALAIVSLPAAVPNSDPAFGGTIFVNPGGPGGSGVSFALDDGANMQATADTETSKYEILGWDPRGVQLSTPQADCYGDLFARDADAIQRLAVGPLDAGEDALRRQWARAHGFGELCSKGAVNGSIIPYATTASVVRDMVEMLDKIQELREEEEEEAVARVVGDGKGQKPMQARGEKEVLRMLYWGFSYGSLLGNTFASMYPGRVGRVILDGIVDADDYVAGGWTTNLQDTEELIEHFYKSCFTSGPKCALNRPSDTKWQDVRARVDSLHTRLDTAPVAVLNSGKATTILTGYSVVDAFKEPMYQPHKRWVPLAEGLSAAVDGNYTYLLNVAAGDFPPLDQACAAPNGTTPYTTTPGDAGQACLCGDADDATGMTLKDYAGYVQQLIGQSPTFAGYWAQIRLACTAWEIGPRWRFTGPFSTPEADPRGVEGKPAAPVLFMSSRLDPVTPLRNAYKMSERHHGAEVLVHETVGHSAAGVGSKCMKKVVQEYFEHGTMPAKGTTCEPDCDPWDGDACWPSTAGIRVAPLAAPHRRAI